jgi:DNA ligase (NAD+)
MKKELKTEESYLKLVDEILEHDRHYYDECKPVISDYEYDQRLKQLEKFEKKHSNLIAENSPTKRVSESPSKGFKQGKHETPMLSLANTYSEKEIDDFIKRVEKLLNQKDLSYCVELKMDGTAISIRYEKGVLKRALTRGNGKIGDDVTSNVKTIKTIPLSLHVKDVPEVLEIRGEVFMHKNTFYNLNLQREEDGLEPWANPRNAAAGSLKLLDSREVARRKLGMVCYGIADGEEILDSQFEVHKYLKEMHLPVSKENCFAKCKNIEEILDFANKIKEIRSKLSFEIDGIVIKVDDLNLHNKLGATGKSPRFAVAYKFAPEQAVSKINDITVQVGRTGVLTPVAELESVKLAGSTISRATLHNQDEIKRKDIRINDHVIIEKGGDVIPKVVSVDLKKRPKDSKPWKMPGKCPICDALVIHKPGEVAIRCPNSKCEGRKLRYLAFFASKVAMDIDHMGERVVEQLFNKGLIRRVSDIYVLDEEKLSLLEGFKEKSIHNLLNSIEASKQCPLNRFIMGLEIKYVGKETAELLANYAGDLDSLMKLDKEELVGIEGVGEKVADSIIDFFKDHHNKEEIKLLLSHGVRPGRVTKKKISNHLFSGKTFVLTGALQEYTRDEASSFIKERGGKTSSSVSKNTDYVLVGDDPGSKYTKAQSLGVKILSEKEFQKLL